MAPPHAHHWNTATVQQCNSFGHLNIETMVILKYTLMLKMFTKEDCEHFLSNISSCLTHTTIPMSETPYCSLSVIQVQPAYQPRPVLHHVVTFVAVHQQLVTHCVDDQDQRELEGAIDFSKWIKQTRKTI